MRKGFTILEILIALTILVITFTLITLLYVRGARIRNIINAYNEVGEVLSQMTDTIANGRKKFLGQDIVGLKQLANLTNAEDKSLSFSMDGNTFTYTINNGSLELTTPSGNYNLDPNNKVEILDDSKFEYYYPDGTRGTDVNKITLVKIILIGKSTNPAMKKMVPMRIETAVRLKNKTSF